MVVTPLITMRLRTAQLQSALGASFGTVRNWNAQVQAYTRVHQGWDLAAPVGTACRAIADGVVEHVGAHPQYGNEIILRFSRTGNQLQSLPGDVLFAHYAHLSVTLVTAGQQVRAGDQIGLTGISGNAAPAAPHLHFEIRTTAAPNPGGGMVHRLDPGDILGYQHLQCE